MNPQQGQFLCPLKHFVYYLITLDTSKDHTYTEQITMFIKGVIIHGKFKLYKKYPTLYFIHGLAKGTYIFCEFHTTLQETHLDSSKLFLIATNGCHSML